MALWLILLVYECFVGVGGGCPLSGWLPLVYVLKFKLINSFRSTTSAAGKGVTVEGHVTDVTTKRARQGTNVYIVSYGEITKLFD